ncbi:class I adenylate-forming enzyme family protein [Gordonia sp. SL306]|uniref:class I adenylate-forming enzyme family protein n=1 Tax=Gordonia sp. SL306 TaxID=2995145 RepID=UPI002271741E|nr:class I adenylate-forming enzyme family protein [Gordonia sp. SL306]WAC54010.1 class I adenylate-forming enzyme family protein [Gordonia sp. SL306]
MTGIRQALRELWSAPDDARMIQQDGRWYTWGEVRALAEKIDRELTGIGACGGSRIGVVLGNRMESIAALVALLSTGRTITTLNPMQPIGRLTADLHQSRPRVVLAPAKLWDSVEFSAVAADLAVDGFAIDTGLTRRATGSVSVEDDAKPSATVAIEMFTSGTTGPPKRIPLTWRQLDAAMSAVHGHVGTSSSTRQPSTRQPLTGRVALVTLAIVHIGGMWGVLQALTEARPFVLLPRFTVAGWVGAIEEHKPRIASLPPAAMRSLLNADIPGEKLESLRAVTAGTTFVSPDLADEFIGRYDIPVLIVYGATEFSGAVAGWTKPMHAQWWAKKRGSVGRAFPGVQLRVVDDQKAVLPQGVTGALEVCSGQTGSGSDEWVHTSDLAHIDDDGFLYIDGRADDAIVRGGFKVQPEVVANALRGHSAILDATVYGKDDDRLGQVPVAVVELVDGTRVVDEAELKEFLRGHLTGYEVPVAIHAVESLPRSVSLKVDRRRLLELVAELEASSA